MWVYYEHDPVNNVQFSVYIYTVGHTGQKRIYKVCYKECYRKNIILEILKIDHFLETVCMKMNPIIWACSSLQIHNSASPEIRNICAFFCIGVPSEAKLEKLSKGCHIADFVK